MVPFITISRQGTTAWVRKKGGAVIAAALLDGEGCSPAGKAGRSEVLRFPFEGGWGIVRLCRRGGLLGLVLKDAYLLINRPQCELQAHLRLYELGLSTPEPLGAAWERRGLWYRGAVATREVDAVDLAAFLTAEPVNAGDVLREVGRLIRRMHDLGCYHADLQVRNILMGRDGPCLIDFDKARLYRRLSELRRARNLLRLRRSLSKNALPAAFFDAIREGYGECRIPIWLQRLYDLKGSLSDILAGRACGAHHP